MPFEPTKPMTLEEVRDFCISNMNSAVSAERYRMQNPNRQNKRMHFRNSDQFVNAARILGYSIEDAVGLFLYRIYDEPRAA